MVQIPTVRRHRLKSIPSPREIAQWGTDVEQTIDQIIESLGQIGDATNGLLSVTSEPTITRGRRVVAHAPSHLPNGTDPLATGIADTIDPGDTPSAGGANSFSRSDHQHGINGLFVVGPATSVVDNLATYDNLTGDIKDSGIAIGSIPVGPGVSVVNSIPTFSNTTGDIQDPNDWQIASAHLVPTLTDTSDIGLTGTRPRDLWLGRDADITGRLNVGSDSAISGASDEGVVLDIAELSSVRFDGVVPNGLIGLRVRPTFDSFITAEVTASQYKAVFATGFDVGGNSLRVLDLDVSGTVANLPTGAFSDLTMCYANISVSFPATTPYPTTAFRGFVVDNLRFPGITGAAPYAAAFEAAGVMQGTQNYGLLTIHPIRLRSQARLWFGVAAAGGTPLNSLRAGANSGSAATGIILGLGGILATNDIIRFTPTALSSIQNGACSLGANAEGFGSLWLKDTSAAFEVQTVFTSNPILNADRVLTVDMDNANQTLVPAWLGQDVGPAASPIWITPTVTSLKIDDSASAFFLELLNASNQTAARAVTYDTRDTAQTWPADYLDFLFGDGSDGSPTISVNTTLTQDMYYADLTINAAIVLTLDGYTIHVRGTLTNNGVISADGGNGGNAAGATGGVGVLGNTNRNVGGSTGGTAGATGTVGPSVGTQGTAPTAAAGMGGTGGTGGAGGQSTGNAGGATGGATSTSLRQWRHLTARHYHGATATVIQGGTGGRGGSSGGAEGVFDTGGGGGGGGSGGGVACIIAMNIVNAGTIRANGGTGGNGGASVGADSGGGGGGGGGGGWVIIGYKTIPTVGTIQANGGAPGTGGIGSSGFNGANGGNGVNGVVLRYDCSKLEWI